MLSILIIVFLTGCNSRYENNTAEPSEQFELSDSETELNVFQTITYEDGSPEKDMGFERIELLTDAGKDGGGDFMWDDGNQFSLKVITATGEIEVMPLERFQFASFQVASFFKLDENDFCILINIASGAGYEMREYTFCEDERRFEKKIVYEADNINYMRQSECT